MSNMLGILYELVSRFLILGLLPCGKWCGAEALSSRVIGTLLFTTNGATVAQETIQSSIAHHQHAVPRPYPLSRAKGVAAAAEPTSPRVTSQLAALQICVEGETS